MALMDRIEKVIADEARVAQFEIVVCDNDCKVYIRTTWGPVINTYAPRQEWHKAVTQALDELEEIKPKHQPKTAKRD